jgi:hypothetical protein
MGKRKAERSTDLPEKSVMRLSSRRALHCAALRSPPPTFHTGAVAESGQSRCPRKLLLTTATPFPRQRTTDDVACGNSSFPATQRRVVFTSPAACSLQYSISSDYCIPRTGPSLIPVRTDRPMFPANRVSRRRRGEKGTSVLLPSLLLLSRGSRRAAWENDTATCIRLRK